MPKNHMRAGEAAEYLNISYQMLRKYILSGAIQHDTTPSGQAVFTTTQLETFLGHEDTPRNHATAFYARDSQGDTERIKQQLNQLETAYGTPTATYTDKTSGLNEKRRGLAKLLCDAKIHKFDTLCITAKDRLTRFGYEYLYQLLEEYGVTIHVLDERQDKTTQEELIQDFMSLLASFSGKYYQLRSIKHEKMLLELADKQLEEKQ